MPDNSQGFFDRPQINQTPNPEPPGFNLLRDMLMRRAFELNANPYGLTPNYSGPPPFSPYGRGRFNPYSGGYGGGMGGPMPMGGGMGGRVPQTVGPRMGGGGMASGGPTNMGGPMGSGQGPSLAQMLMEYLGQQGGAGGPGGAMGRGGPSLGGGMGMVPREPSQGTGGGGMRQKPAVRGEGHAMPILAARMDAEPSYDGAVGVKGGFVGEEGFTPWAAGGGMRMAAEPGMQMFGPAGGGGGGGGFGGGALPMRRRRPMLAGYEGQTAVGVAGGYSTQGPGGTGFVPWNSDRYRGGATPPTPTPFSGGSPVGGGAGGLQGGFGAGSPPSAARGTPRTPGAGELPWWQSFPQWSGLQYPPGDPRNAGPGTVTRPGGGGSTPGTGENPEDDGGYRSGGGRGGYDAASISMPVRLAMGMKRRSYDAAPMAAPLGGATSGGAAGGTVAGGTAGAAPTTPIGTVAPGAAGGRQTTTPAPRGGAGGPYTPDGRVRDFFGNVHGQKPKGETNFGGDMNKAFAWMDDALRGMGDNPEIAQRPSDANDRAATPRGTGGTQGQGDQTPRP